MTINATLSFQVPDYDVWQAAFLLDKAARKEASIDATPYRNLDDPNHVLIISTGPSKEAFMEFFRIQNDKKESKPRELLVRLISISCKKDSSATAESPLIQKPRISGAFFWHNPCAILTPTLLRSTQIDLL